LATVVEGALVLAALTASLRQSGSSNPPVKSQRNHIRAGAVADRQPMAITAITAITAIAIEPQPEP
jgi:hypothetical protein